MSFLQKSIYLLLVAIWLSILHYPLSLFDLDSWFLTLAIWPLSFLILRMYSFGFWPKLFSLAGTNEHFSQSGKKTLSHFTSLGTYVLPALTSKPKKIGSKIYWHTCHHTNKRFYFGYILLSLQKPIAFESKKVYLFLTVSFTEMLK